MVMFDVFGPYDVPVSQAPRGLFFDAPDIERFWRQCPEIAERRGCYVFALRSARGATPSYVGKAAVQTFEAEVFSADKQNKYIEALVQRERGRPEMYFVPCPVARGRVNESVIREVETFLIRLAAAINPSLINVHGTTPDAWAIKGALRGGPGKPSAAAAAFKQVMGL